MASFPAVLSHVGVPPIKCQGIKTKLVRFIAGQIHWQGKGRWIEPFLGSGVVVLNVLPDRALLADTNRHIIRFYQAIQERSLTGDIIREFLQQEGAKLQANGDYYYEVRDRFNQSGSPLDFLFLNRACFNGLIRFNQKGQFNVPFCRKPNRFAPAYITKIANQVDWAARQMADKDWEFCVSPWQETFDRANPEDFVYLDPPYIGRHTDYYNGWNLPEAEELAIAAQTLPCPFALSMWLENQHRQNEHIQHAWQGLELRVYQHFYHVGSKENWRGAVTEALLLRLIS
jgi:DNA adenine methylase